MDAHQTADRLLSRAKAAGLINPVTGEGAPTREQIAFELDLYRDSAAMDELATYACRLVRLVRKTDPSNKVAADCVEFLRCIGRTNPLR